MATLAWIPDGYNETGILNEAPGLHPAIRFTYRRMTTEEYVQHGRTAENLNAEQAERLMAAHLAGRIKAWDLKGPKGDPAPVSEDTVRRLVRAVFTRLWLIVAGVGAPDKVVEETAGDAEAALQDALAAAREGRPLALVREERERGN